MAQKTPAELDSAKVKEAALLELVAMIKEAEAAAAAKETWTQNEFQAVIRISKIIDFYLKDIADPDWKVLLIRLPAGFLEVTYLGLVDMMHHRGYTAKLNDPQDPYRPDVSFPYLGIHIIR